MIQQDLKRYCIRSLSYHHRPYATQQQPKPILILQENKYPRTAHRKSFIFDNHPIPKNSKASLKRRLSDAINCTQIQPSLLGRKLSESQEKQHKLKRVQNLSFYQEIQNCEPQPQIPAIKSGPSGGKVEPKVYIGGSLSMLDACKITAKKFSPKIPVLRTRKSSMTASTMSHRTMRKSELGIETDFEKIEPWEGPNQEEWVF